MSPPRPQARKKRNGVRAAEATMAGVRKMPMPMTRLTTIIVASNVLSLGFMASTTGWGAGRSMSATHMGMMPFRESVFLLSR